MPSVLGVTSLIGTHEHSESLLVILDRVFSPAGVIQVKELTLSSDIALHDLDTKLKQVTSWLEKKHHVRLTLRPRQDQSEQALVNTPHLYYHFIVKPLTVICSSMMMKGKYRIVT